MCTLCNNYGKKLTYLEPPDSAQRLRVNRYSLKTFSVISGVPLVFFTIEFQKWAQWQLLMLRITNWLKLLGTIVPTTTGHRKIAGLYVWKKMLVSIRQIKEKLLFNIKLLRLSPLTIQFQHGYKQFAFISFSTKLPSWKILNDITEVKTCLNHCFA